MKIIELFSGIGGFAKGFEEAGYHFDEHYFSEIDKHAIANYKYNFPNAKYIGSVTDIPNGNFTGIDLITFGSPCQDFSLAGQRKGLNGDRSSLIKEAIRLITDIRPVFFIWENVKGAFSSNAGADFTAILQEFANIGGGYRLEWQLLNTKWFLPQNRERIYLVGHLATTERSFRPIFPIGENDEVFIRKTRQESRKSSSKQIAYSRTINSRIHKMGSDDTYIRTNGKLRRLTEIECERLQGFPDNWTKYGDFNGEIKEISATQRYKMIGNAVSIPVVKEIAKRLKQ